MSWCIWLNLYPNMIVFYLFIYLLLFFLRISKCNLIEPIKNKEIWDVDSKSEIPNW